MRLSQFWQLMDAEFGSAYARSLASHQRLTSLGGVTADEALEAGVAHREIWLALCEQMNVPVQRRLGSDTRSRPKRE
ncbi:MAG: DUF3046 domain-containing protein [Micrococcales bacterium]|nr:DUF3046 domain-containing protein [Micrococcales bacterium]